jgi:broad specificity phosphatase PhoE
MNRRGVDVDAPAVSASLRRLDELAARHPEIRGPRGDENIAGWVELLQTDEKGPPMTPKATEPGEQIAIRLPKELVARIDRHAERLAEQNPGLAFTRSDAIRTLLTRALNIAEQQDDGARKQRKK